MSPSLALIAQLRAAVGDHPFLTFFVIAMLWRMAYAMMHLAPRRTSGPLAAAAGAIGISVYAAIAIWYAVAARSYYDFAEPTVASIAWLFERGQPIYHAIDAAERYAHIYGPLAFMIPGWFMAAMGPSLVTSKIVGVLAGLLSVVVVFVVLRTATTASRALALTGLFALLCLTFRNTSFWIRPDSFALLFASTALLASVAATPGWLAAIGVGVCGGLLLNLKFTGLLYALPALTILATRVGVGAVAGAGLTTAIVAAVPFVAFSNVSLANYLAWVRLSAGNGLSGSLLRHNVEWALFMLMTLFAGRVGMREREGEHERGRRRNLAALAIGVIIVVVAASKPGAGPYHLLPFWPAMLYIVAQGRALPPPAFVATTIIVATLQQAYFVGVMRSADDAEVDAAADVVGFVDANPGRTVAMGYANAGERWTYVRPVMVFRTGRYPIDAPAVQEFQMSGLPMPEATIDALRRCDTEFWLIPKAATPFAGPNKYPSMLMAPLFPESFTRAFGDAYEHDPARDTRFFDVWRCRRVR